MTRGAKRDRGDESSLDRGIQGQPLGIGRPALVSREAPAEWLGGVSRVALVYWRYRLLLECRDCCGDMGQQQGRENRQSKHSEYPRLSLARAWSTQDESMRSKVVISVSRPACSATRGNWPCQCIVTSRSKTTLYVEDFCWLTIGEKDSVDRHKRLQKMQPVAQSTLLASAMHIRLSTAFHDQHVFSLPGGNASIDVCGLAWWEILDHQLSLNLKSSYPTNTDFGTHGDPILCKSSMFG